MEDLIIMSNPSELCCTENKEKKFREYNVNKGDYIQKRVRETYKKMHTNQTVEFALNRKASWTKFDKGGMTIMEVLEKLNGVVDEADPDLDIPNNFHGFQTAEKIRKAHPELDWFHLTGLIHDLGKVMILFGEPQWAVVGDTYPLGCYFADSVVYQNITFNENLDMKDTRYNTKIGMYTEKCGLENVLMSWGHDEYLYHVLVNHKSSLPDEALYIIRFHSFYPWHTSGDYNYLCNNKDMAMLPWVKEFSKFDLYSKSKDIPDVKSLLPYYQTLIDKYIPGVVQW